MDRRQFLINTSWLWLAGALPALAKEGTGVALLIKTKSEWKALLPPDRYAVLFEEDTERSSSSPLNHEFRHGQYVCAACNQLLFKSTQKFDSGTGWPSFFDVLPGAVATREDFRLVLPRTEYHCSHCGGHQGHVFKDGPAPTGLRYCNNGLALQFIQEGGALPALRS